MEPWKIYAGIAAFIVLAPIVSYNRFVRQRHLIRNAWANIDSELRRRYDLIPNLVETVKGYAAHERAVFETVTRARSAAADLHAPPAEQAKVENELVRGLRSLLALAESYPELKASRAFLNLQEELAVTEDRIQAARRLYNANVNAYNTRIEAFPSNIIARLFGFTHEDLFEVEQAVRDAASVAGLADLGGRA